MMSSQDLATKPTLSQTATGSLNSTQVYPDQRQAWGLVVTMSIALCILFGTTLDSFGVFALPVMNTFQSSNEQIANIPTAFMFTMTLTMPIAGWLLDRIGPRIVMATGATLMGAGYLFASVSNDLNSVTLALAVSGIGVGASTYVPAVALIMRWVKLERQGLALGMLLAGGSIGTIVFPMLLTHITELHGWRYSMQVIAALSLLACVPLLLWQARLPNQSISNTGEHFHAQEVPGKSVSKALRLPRYWSWVAMQVLLTLSTLGILVNIIPYLISVGHTPQEAAIIYAITSFAGLLGAFLFGMLSSFWNIKPVLMFGTVIGALGICALLMANDPTFGFSAIIIFAIAWGATFNLVNQLSPMLMEATVGQRNFGTLLGIGSLVAGIGAAFSPKLVGYLLDSSGNYSMALLLCAACTVAALIPIAYQPKA